MTGKRAIMQRHKLPVSIAIRLIVPMLMQEGMKVRLYQLL